MDNLDVYAGFPKENINFVDIFPVFRNQYLMNGMASAFRDAIEKIKPIDSVTAVAAPESRGFCFGLLVAGALGVPFIPFRKAGKLPCEVVVTSYDLEYGSATLELPKGVLTSHDNVLIVDDLLAVGGTMKAMIDTIQMQTEATVHSGVTLVNLADLPKPEFSVPVVSILDLKDI
ncbi:MAG: adenine phosphoribosyltransferase [Clostridia bacterium]|nr:adenine phosphoribosyltransferase [Clostridia bacterium]